MLPRQPEALVCAARLSGHLGLLYGAEVPLLRVPTHSHLCLAHPSASSKQSPCPTRLFSGPGALYLTGVLRHPAVVFRRPTVLSQAEALRRPALLSSHLGPSFLGETVVP